MEKQKNDIKNLLKFLLLTLFIFIVIFSGLYFFSGFYLTKSLILGYVTSVFNIIIGYFSIRWAFTKKAKTFYMTLYGGMALRFVLFIVVMYILYLTMEKIFLVVFVISFILFYVLMQIFEIKLVNRELKRKPVV